jgi:hypothetical protein
MANGGGPHGHDLSKEKKQPKTKGERPAVKTAKAASAKPAAKKNG